jgi:uncharacterized protein (DUF302 family)
MTGSLAVVMASLAAASVAPDSERRGQILTSPYSVQETVRRIEAAAQRQGLPVLASLDRTTRHHTQWVVVLGSAEGGTPVQVDSEEETPAVPLAVHVEEGPDGATVVRLPDLAAATHDAGVDSEWPDSVVDELAGLPLLLEQALAEPMDRSPP